MRAARTGDRAAFARLLHEIADALTPVVRAKLSRSGLGAAEAEDIVQEVLIAVHDKGWTWDESRPFGPWLSAIARHKLLDAQRRLSRERARHAPQDIDDLADILPAASDSAPLAADVDRSIDALPRQQRDVVLALAVEGASISDTARRLARSEASVRVTFARAIDRLFRNATRED